MFFEDRVASVLFTSISSTSHNAWWRVGTRSKDMQIDVELIQRSKITLDGGGGEEMRFVRNCVEVWWGGNSEITSTSMGLEWIPFFSPLKYNSVDSSDSPFPRICVHISSQMLDKRRGDLRSTCLSLWEVGEALQVGTVPCSGSFLSWHLCCTIQTLLRALVVSDLLMHQRSSKLPFCLWRWGLQADGRASLPQTLCGLASVSPRQACLPH